MLFRSPVAIRYPKDNIPYLNGDYPSLNEPFVMGKSITLKQGDSDIVIAAFGSIVQEAAVAAKVLSMEGIEVTVINARFAKPVDEKIVDAVFEGKILITVEDHLLACGFGSAVMEAVIARVKSGAAVNGRVINLGCQDEFINADTREGQLNLTGIDAEKIVYCVRNLCR
mgnify:CR=1 FL=1